MLKIGGVHVPPGPSPGCAYASKSGSCTSKVMIKSKTTTTWCWRRQFTDFNVSVEKKHTLTPYWEIITHISVWRGQHDMIARNSSNFCFTLLLLQSYSLWTLQCSSKATCNSVHSLASILPVNYFFVAERSFPSPWGGVLWWAYPPKIEIWNTVNRGICVKFPMSPPPLHKRIEDLLATVLRQATRNNRRRVCVDVKNVVVTKRYYHR